jgi:hypothetical protein
VDERRAAEPDDERPPLPVPDFGPYDAAVAPEDGVPRLDLGALRIPNVPGVGLQLEATPDGHVGRVLLEHEGSRLRLSVHAAPRTEGIWEEVREELRLDLASKGAKVVEVQGDYGPQLAARQPAQGGFVEARYIGVNGPRWLVMAVVVGPAAADPDRDAVFRSVLHDLVVDRGSEARPVKELVPLRLPPALAAQLAQATEAQAKAQQARAQQASQAQAVAAQAAAARAAQAQPEAPATTPPRPVRTRPAGGGQGRAR